jgi:hypothetical protein
MDVISGLPGVITLRLSLPFDEILQGMTASKVSVVPDGLHLVLHLTFDKIWQQSGEIWSMLCRLMIGQLERCMKHIMYSPHHGEFQLICHRGYFLDYLEWSIPFWHQFG